MRLLMTAFVFGIPETKMRCIAPQRRRRLRRRRSSSTTSTCSWRRSPRRSAGRSSGSRRAARTTPRRRTAATTSRTSRSARSATARSPRSRPKTYANLGGVLSTIAPGIPTTLYGRMLSGAYRIPNIHCQVLGVYTNTGHGRRLPRRRPARGDLRRRAGRRPRRARARARPGRGAARELHPAGRVPVRPGGILARARRTTPATTRRRSTGRSRSSTTTSFRAEQEQRPRGGAPRRDRVLDLRRDLRRRAVGVDRRGRRGLGRLDVGERERPRPPHRQGRRHDRHPAAGPGPRDDDRADRRGRARHPDRGRHRRARRHARHAVRLRHLREPQRGGRRRPPSTTASRRSRTKARRIARAHARGAARGHRLRGRQGRSSRARPSTAKTIQEIAGAAALAYDLPEGEEPFLDDIDLLRPAELHVPVRHARRGGRGRRRDGRGGRSCATSRSTTSAR